MKEVAVIAKNHEKWGETPYALILLHESKYENQEELELYLLTWINSKVSKIQRVSNLHILNESFPRTVLGKVLK